MSTKGLDAYTERLVSAGVLRQGERVKLLALADRLPAQERASEVRRLVTVVCSIAADLPQAGASLRPMIFNAALLGVAARAGIPAADTRPTGSPEAHHESRR